MSISRTEHQLAGQGVSWQDRESHRTLGKALRMSAVVTRSCFFANRCPAQSVRGQCSGALVLWCFVSNPHRCSPYSKLPFCITRYAVRNASHARGEGQSGIRKGLEQIDRLEISEQFEQLELLELLELLEPLDHWTSGRILRTSVPRRKGRVARLRGAIFV